MIQKTPNSDTKRTKSPSKSPSRSATIGNNAAKVVSTPATVPVDGTSTEVSETPISALAPVVESGTDVVPIVNIATNAVPISATATVVPISAATDVVTTPTAPAVDTATVVATTSTAASVVDSATSSAATTSPTTSTASTSDTSSRSSGAVKRKLTRKANFACIPKHEFAYLFDAVSLDHTIKMALTSEESTQVAVNAVNERFFNCEQGQRDVSKHYLCPHFTHDNTTPCFISERYSALKEHLLTHEDSYYFCFECESKFYNKRKAIAHFETVCNHLKNKDNGYIANLIIDLKKETIDSFKRNNPFQYMVLSKDEFHMASLACKKSHGFRMPYNSDGTIDSTNLAKYMAVAVEGGNKRKRTGVKKSKTTSQSVSPTQTELRTILVGNERFDSETSDEEPPSQAVSSGHKRISPAKNFFMHMLGGSDIKETPQTQPTLSVVPRITVTGTRPRIPVANHPAGYVIPLNPTQSVLNSSMPFPVYPLPNQILFTKDLTSGHFERKQSFSEGELKAPVTGPFSYAKGPGPIFLPFPRISAERSTVVEPSPKTPMEEPEPEEVVDTKEMPKASAMTEFEKLVHVSKLELQILQKKSELKTLVHNCNMAKAGLNDRTTLDALAHVCSRADRMEDTNATQQ